MHRAKYYIDRSPGTEEIIGVDIDINIPRSNSVIEDITPGEREIICTKISLSDLQKIIRQKIYEIF